MINNDNLISKFTELLASHVKPSVYLRGDAQGLVPQSWGTACLCSSRVLTDLT